MGILTKWSHAFISALRCYAERRPQGAKVRKEDSGNGAGQTPQPMIGYM